MSITLSVLKKGHSKKSPPGKSFKKPPRFRLDYGRRFVKVGPQLYQHSASKISSSPSPLLIGQRLVKGLISCKKVGEQKGFPTDGID
jgi:hypothetical protein